MAGSSSFSSSNVSLIPTGLQVFISYRGKELHDGFVSFLLRGFKDKNINVFTNEQEEKGKDLISPCDRISESRFALVIFSEGYTKSKRCLDELVHIKERVDQGKLRVIPIFYKLDATVVNGLKGKFGDNFRDLVERYQHEPKRIQKWTEALNSTSQTFDMPLPAYRILEEKYRHEPETFQQWKSALNSIFPKLSLTLSNYSETSENDFISLICKGMNGNRGEENSDCLLVPARGLSLSKHEAPNSLMAASSSVVRPNSLGPQVFINFRGIELRRNFISFLYAALKEADINVFIDEDEHLGSNLVNLLKRIEESEIALVIFSKDYTSSHWCLDELAKIMERKDQGRLIVVPIFYKIEPYVVKQLKGEFGDCYRDMKRGHQHQRDRTQKWKEALVSIPEIKGMVLPERSNVTDREFIISMVDKIQILLEDMTGRGNLERNRTM
ncbi:PREDICTED: uncharacterized protein LOC104760431 isoform X2 [Camelina sativa]|uniref:Uncharacterized protein LOC104760431 isoform X1 n=1 Tax=Camelina sativa TaxID=90675 RepID=A0ABM1RA57_CAMSA|nr:PREDICTED: uncharacterized protein LOC104760431 isoform X1 [Camelina sativa]XP_019095895.1 PREDICTED: uncharacterized protein LOC104760431 isoform X2 [Camelina sativa]